jgi:hypothetical protein
MIPYTMTITSTVQYLEKRIRERKAYDLAATVAVGCCSVAVDYSDAGKGSEF